MPGPRFHLDERVERQFGIVDVLPMFQPALRDGKRRVAGMAYATPALDRATWDMLRIKMAKMIGYVLGSTMREGRATEEGLTEDMIGKLNMPAEAELPPRLRAAALYGQAFRTDPANIPDALRDDLAAHYTPQQIAQIVLNNLFGVYMAKVIVACGLDPATSGDVTNNVFDTKSFDSSRGSIGMIKQD